MVSFNLALLGALTSATVSLAHMQMSWPYPFKSSFNPANSYTDIDYSMTQPLGTYPCKGYIDPSAPTVVSWAAGSTINYTLAGTAIHGGGSCQLAMSYDEGKTWNVIQSIIGGCVIESLTEKVTIPKEAPSGKALFAWNWFNLQGNREMYQNCAPVDITNGGSGLDSTDYPAPFVANVDAAPGCATIENIAVVFPHPGKNVRYGGSYAGTTPTPGAGITGNCGTVSSTPNSGTTSSSPVSSAAAAGETLFKPSSSSSISATATASSASSSTSSATASNLDHAANANSNSTGDVSSAATASSTSATSVSSASSSPKKCKRSSMHKRHERLVRRSPHERLVRRRITTPMDSFVQ